MLRASSLVLLFTLAPLPRAAGQSASPLSPGMHVRITVDSLSSVKGTVIGSAGPTFQIAPDNRADTIEVEYSRVDRLEVSRGMRNRVLHDALWGGGMLGALGAVVGAASDAGTDPQFVWYKDAPPPDGCSAIDPRCTKPPRETESPPFLKKTLKGLGIGAAAGLLAGAVVGKLRKSEVWHRLSPEEYRVHVAVAPAADNGVILRLSLAM